MQISPKYKACTSLWHKAVKEYSLRKTEAENAREFWDTYRPFLHSKKNQQQQQQQGGPTTMH